MSPGRWGSKRTVVRWAHGRAGGVTGAAVREAEGRGLSFFNRSTVPDRILKLQRPRNSQTTGEKVKRAVTCRNLNSLSFLSASLAAAMGEASTPRRIVS